jgi:hypothetical protein
MPRRRSNGAYVRVRVLVQPEEKESQDCDNR